MNNSDRFKRITDEMAKIYAEKNEKYGNSFEEVIDDVGYVSAYVQIAHKVKRLKSLIVGKQENNTDESLEDTLLDLANYSIMTVMALQKEPSYTNIPMISKAQRLEHEKMIDKAQHKGPVVFDRHGSDIDG